MREKEEEEIKLKEKKLKYKICKFWSNVVSVLLFASVKRFSVSCLRYSFLFYLEKNLN